ncbi:MULTISPECIES: enoyl-CoA hydratase/isomerase family protein [Streptomyces]|uniref:2-cyclohexenylcarbonyl CoA isomerase n=1 Tax=Streptomyces TaxID=1883 RepID=UPI000F6DF031|nr:MULTISPECIES: enoyl-CoA hydratase-related protein [unclassified Streptomyces]AZM91009.1 enoyl-CoA hydratase [Streptomyces sp. W1SF4]RSS54505.1 enoyl-CoA hydratase [Streptomyces sp. WAC07061]
MADSVLYEVTDGLATVTINRPDAMNAMNTEAKVALRDAVQAAAADTAVRAVLLTAAGDRAFCVGQDLKEHIGNLAADRENGSTLTMSTVSEHYNPIVRALTEMPKPVVAAVNGVAAGAGFGFALAADFRVVSETASFNTSFAGVALTADSGVSWTLPRLIGASRASDLLLFPRTVKAREAFELGIVNRLVPAESLRAEAEKVARTLASGPTVAYAAVKESLAYGASHSLSEALEREDVLQTRAGASEDHSIAVEAFLAKQQPRYLGR